MIIYFYIFLLRCWLVLVGTPQLLARNGNCDSLTSRKEEDSPASACPSFAVDRTTETSSCLQAPCERHAARASHIPLQDALTHRVFSFCARVRLTHILYYIIYWPTSRVGRIRSRLPERPKSALLMATRTSAFGRYSYSAGDFTYPILPESIPFIQERCQYLFQLRSPTQLRMVET